jgi:hypothetical protein
MSDESAAFVSPDAIATLMGAAVGAAGAILTTIFTIRHESRKIERERRAEREKELQGLVGKYLSISQDTVESLWYSLENVYRGHARVMADKYHEITTLYALARFFAVKRIMMLEGAYSKIEAAYPSYPSAFLSMITPQRRLEEERFLRALAQDPSLRRALESLLRRFKIPYKESPGLGGAPPKFLRGH